MILDLLTTFNITNNTLSNYLPIFLHTFDYQTIKEWKNTTDFPTSYLTTLESLPDSLENIR